MPIAKVATRSAWSSSSWNNARRVLTADRGLIAEVERLSEDTVNLVKSMIVEAGDAAEGSSGPPPTR